MSSRPLIAIDIDDVVSDSIEATRLWANAEAGLELEPHHYHVEADTYWDYYERIWATHGAGLDVLNYDSFIKTLVDDQAHVPLYAGAAFGIKQLMNTYDVVFVTARSPELEVSTKQWLEKAFGQQVSLYMSHNPFSNGAAKTKGDICKELGAFILIDDNPGNCQSVLEAGLGAILFGKYGWQSFVPEGAVRCADWPSVVEYLGARQ